MGRRRGAARPDPLHGPRIGFLWGPLTIVAFGLDGHAPWFWPAIGAFSLLMALVMFVYVRRDVKDFVAELDEG